MKLRRLGGYSAVVSIGIFIAFSAFVASTSCSTPKDVVRAQDRVEIEQLMWDYIRALDSGNAEAYVAVYAPDGQFKAGAMAIKGREALMKMMVDSKKQMEDAKKSDKKPAKMYHIVTNPHIEFIDQDHARFYAYWMGGLAAGGTTSAGREVNDLVKLNGKWLISVRDVAPQD
jgi:uncharacterized protein (TIGR02246 family)